MDSAQQQLTEKITAAANILVTVSRNPSVDQLSACIALTLILNKLNKHATGVFSGAVPSTMEFLKPEGTLEKNTDSLRDFIIALDKSKADKLRYKVEDQLVRIFITPYRTSINQDDLEFSQGDFNVDLVVALGVSEQADLDTAITAHGRILHDATVSSITTTIEGTLGSINWHDAQVSCLCELIATLAQSLGQGLLDSQISTALLTGIVAETARFSNQKTSAQTMAVAGVLLAAGADQQLVATQLQPAPIVSQIVPPVAEVPAPEPPAAIVSDDGTLDIIHDDKLPEEPRFEDEPQEAEPSLPSAVDPEPGPQPEPPASDSAVSPPVANETPQMDTLTLPDEQPELGESTEQPSGTRLVVNPPSLGGTLTANSRPEPDEEETVDPLNASPTEGFLKRPTLPQPSPPTLPRVSEPLLTGFTPPPPAWVPPSADALNFGMATTGPTTTDTNNTLEKIEEAVHSPHLQVPSVNAARDKVSEALQQTASPGLEPIEALNANPLGPELHHDAAAPTIISPSTASSDFTNALQQAIPQVPLPSPVGDQSLPAVAPPPSGSTAPPVPPPILPYRFGSTTEPPASTG